MANDFLKTYIENTWDKTGSGGQAGIKVGQVVQNLVKDPTTDNFTAVDFAYYNCYNSPLVWTQRPDYYREWICEVGTRTNWTCKYEADWVETDIWGILYQTHLIPDWDLIHQNDFTWEGDGEPGDDYTITSYLNYPTTSQNTGVYILPLKQNTNYVLQIFNDVSQVDPNEGVAWLYGKDSPLFIGPKIVLCNSHEDRQTEYSVQDNYMFFNSKQSNYALLIIPGVIGKITAKDENYYEYRAWESKEQPRVFVFESDIPAIVDREGKVTGINNNVVGTNSAVKKQHTLKTMSREEVIQFLNDYPPKVTLVDGLDYVDIDIDVSVDSERAERFSQFLKVNQLNLCLVPRCIHGNENRSYRSKSFPVRTKVKHNPTWLRTISCNNTSGYDPYRAIWEVDESGDFMQFHKNTSNLDIYSTFNESIYIPIIALPSECIEEDMISTSVGINYRVGPLSVSDLGLNLLHAFSLCAPYETDSNLVRYACIAWSWGLISQKNEDPLPTNWGHVQYEGTNVGNSIYVDRRLTYINPYDEKSGNEIWCNNFKLKQIDDVQYLNLDESTFWDGYFEICDNSHMNPPDLYVGQVSREYWTRVYVSDENDDRYIKSYQHGVNDN